MECSDVYQRAVELLEGGGWVASFRADYSGRGMCGVEVFAIVTDAPGTIVGGAVFAAACELSEFGSEPVFSEISGLLPKISDSMGRYQTVYY